MPLVPAPRHSMTDNARPGESVMKYRRIQRA
jgi:hypothetical protein